VGTSQRPSEYNTRGAALDNAMALLMTVQDLIEQTGEHSLSISGKTAEGEQAIERGNVRLASVIFGDVHQASRHQRVLLAQMQSDVVKARAALASARAGE
jgi:hypothetical protein